ncbi:DUF309 domain-containing protein [Vulcanisaeta distributa]|uniref:DUF309 domain-containing protein n=1 Tax=Vulcanisaeta distributa TaxID=164451 RepID=UPI000ABAF905|nr:DUF309 domain-containing protein [Vulcanisaeta distributa]
MNLRKATKLKIINIRVASSHLEIDLNVDTGDYARTIENLGFEIKNAINIDLEEDEEYNEECAIKRYIELFNEERFWEAHEVLEKIWRKNRDEGIQGLIILAASLVKIQENNLDAFKRLIIKAKELITKNQIPYINKEKLLRKMDNALLIMKPFKIEREDLGSIQKA